jgi:hypothetical protein
VPNLIGAQNVAVGFGGRCGAGHDANPALAASRQPGARLFQEDAAGGRRLEDVCRPVELDGSVVWEESDDENGAGSCRASVVPLDPGPVNSRRRPDSPARKPSQSRQ